MAKEGPKVISDVNEIRNLRVSVKLAAQLLKLSPERVRQLGRAGWIQIDDGTVNLTQALVGWERAFWYGKDANL